ncbi:TPA: ATP-binding protein [Legionella pneumophila]|nr:AAA family ATPase [Legionella pneumophila]HAT2049516.1 ATP-binding protein [Legionella pneumophila]HAT4009204.1 ATP-binding protein [Legionella pneumophila]HAT6364320.1 ATP-binding protein [Legionella pneumophila]HAT6367651.1 ATP-binding protein [Legionella pneumophila]HAT6371049.1 ATP-binding protein [Legionella pneumophila]
MLKKLKIKFGKADSFKYLDVDIGSITIFVGPNNSGKSLVLREIEKYSTNGKQTTHKIIENIEYEFPGDDEFDQLIERMTVPVKDNESLGDGHVKYGRFNSASGFKEFNINLASLKSWKNQNQQNFMSYYVSMFVSRFGGKERFHLIQKQPFADLKSPPGNSLTSLFQNDEKRKKVSDLIFEAFKKYFVIDPTSMSSIEIRLSEFKPSSSETERGWSQNSVDFHKRAKPITEFSDGVQAFTGLAMTVIAGEETIMLIDEPEAFLHPSLASLLGRKLTEEMVTRDGNLIVSTHSPFFVMGCLQAGKPMSIVRLTYDDKGISTAKLLSADKISYLFKNPLLRSTGVLQALFHQSVIVTEADADRAFYNEINKRLLYDGNGKGISEGLFLNAQNKQTIWTIIEPLRQMGIPTVGIVDIDFIKDGGSEFSKALNAVGVPLGLQGSFSGLRKTVRDFLDKTGKDMKRDGGIYLLKGEELATAQKFISDLAEYGIFIVPGGELESWLKSLNCSGHGPNWLIQVLTALGSDPANYIRPSDGDVWDFVFNIKKWLTDPNRKGVEVG